MKVVETNTEISEKSQKMTLQGYYDSLPSSTHPKTDFVNMIASQCGVSTATVRNWIAYGMRPSNPHHIELLSQITGIPQNELWHEN